MNLEELKNLDFEDPGGWPPLAKGAAALLVVIFILVIAYFLQFKDEWTDYETKQRQEVTLKQSFEEKQRRAANLEKYQNQLKDMKAILRELLLKLPTKTEIPNLLQDISQTALSTGISIDRFEPQGEIIKDFYAEKPISLRMVGTYHQFGEFVSRVANLQRVVILTMHDISLKPVEEGSLELVLDGVVKTYRQADDDETVIASRGNQP